MFIYLADATRVTLSSSTMSTKMLHEFEFTASTRPAVLLACTHYWPRINPLRRSDRHFIVRVWPLPREKKNPYIQSSVLHTSFL